MNWPQLFAQAALAAFLLPAIGHAEVEIEKTKTFYFECDRESTALDQLKHICQDMRGKQAIRVWACGEMYYMTVDCEKLNHDYSK
jgi:hypothetical protein